jgi:hypothetical protein
MLYFDFEAGNKAYKLRLNTRSTVQLEKALGCNPLSIFGAGDTIPTVTAMVHILHASLQAMEHGITLEKAYDIFDAYIEDGHSATDFVPIILEIYKVSGLIRDNSAQEEPAEKN